MGSVPQTPGAEVSAIRDQALPDRAAAAADQVAQVGIDVAILHINRQSRRARAHAERAQVQQVVPSHIQQP